ncbi:hypothetical protein CFC21_026380 [Triticum aestivum]|uniref:Uncharacterized protein n=2 Tax=Triticum aestivum TaxID=4565 RepID=A0A9R1EKS4_WHEAT|nr:hypothetical protein CFC21_026380 [Triticum aestivum]
MHLLLLAITAFVVPLVLAISIQPLTDDMARPNHLMAIRSTGAFIAEHVRLLNEIKHDVMKFVVINIALLLVTLTLGFAKQALTFFLRSMGYFGGRYSLPDIIRKVIKGSSLKGPSTTIDVADVLLFTCMALLGSMLFAMTCRRSGVFSVEGLIFLLTLVVYLYLNS